MDFSTLGAFLQFVEMQTVADVSIYPSILQGETKPEPPNSHLLILLKTGEANVLQVDPLRIVSLWKEGGWHVLFFLEGYLQQRGSFACCGFKGFNEVWDQRPHKAYCTIHWYELQHIMCL